MLCSEGVLISFLTTKKLRDIIKSFFGIIKMFVQPTGIVYSIETVIEN